MPYKRMFSDDEFNSMVMDITAQENPDFSALFEIADKQLKPYIRNKCKNNSSSGIKNAEEDVMQEIRIKLLKNCVTGFFLHDRSGHINNDPTDFCKWIYTVANNVFLDYAKKINTEEANVRLFGEGEIETIADDLDPDGFLEEKQEKLKEAFAIVLGSDASVYKSLTWLAQGIIVLKANVTRIQSNRLIVKKFSEKTLYEMRDTIVDAAEDIPWLALSKEQLERINEALNRKHESGKRYGEIPYKAFFMKKGAKSSISDWVNRMDAMIVGRMKNGSSIG